MDHDSGDWRIDHLDSNDPKALGKLAEVCATVITRAMDHLGIEGAFMVILTDTAGNSFITTDVEAGRGAEFAAWATEDMDRARTTTRSRNSKEPLQ